MNDLEYMAEALRLAAEGRGQVSPNPMVGAVVVKDGKIVGRGYHLYANVKHAETVALEQAGEEARGSTVYVTLEPCCHQGRTSPCTDSLIRSGVSRVIAAMRDPNSLVGGKGFDSLRSNGIAVESGLCEEQARRLNEKYIKFIITKRPFVHLKTAMSLDGKTATRTGRSQWITSEQARYRSQLLRAEYDAILVGAGTVLADDPELTMRIEFTRHRPLVRIVLDGRLRTPLTSRILQTASDIPSLFFVNKEAALTEHGGSRLLSSRIDELEKTGAEIVLCFGDDETASLEAVLDELGKRQITSLIVEGGAETSGRFLTSRLIDKVSVFIAPKLIGGKDAAPAIGGFGFEDLDQAMELNCIEFDHCGPDIEITGYPKLK